MTSKKSSTTAEDSDLLMEKGQTKQETEEIVEISLADKLQSLIPVSILSILLLVMGHNMIGQDYLVLGLGILLAIGSAFFGQRIINKQRELAQRISLASLQVLLLLNLLLVLFGPEEMALSLRYIPMYAFGIAAIFVRLSFHRKLSELTDNSRLSSSLFAKSGVLSKVLSTENILLFLLVAIGIALRMYDLMLLDTYRDEDHHLSSARLFLESGSFDYPRAAFLSYLSAFVVQITGAEAYHEYAFWCRVPATIFGTLVAVPLYVLGRKISHGTGLVAAALWILSPWAIGISRIVREHPYYLFVTMSYIVLLVSVLEWVISKPKENSKKILAAVILLALLFVYAFIIDWLSTLKISGIIIAVVTAAYMLSNVSTLLPRLKQNVKFLIPSVLAAGAFLLMASRSKFASLNTTPDVRWADTFMNPRLDSPIHWWHEQSHDSLAIFFLVLAALVFANLYRRKQHLVFAISCFVLIAAYQYFFNRYYAPRYIVYVLPFFVLTLAPIISFGLRSFFLWKDRIIQIGGTAACGLLLFLTFHPQNSVEAVTKKKFLESGAFAVTGEYHNDKDVLRNFLVGYNENILREEPIITSIYEHYLAHEYGFEKEVYKYKYKDPNRFEFVDSIMAANNTGWMILDSHRNGAWKPGFPKSGVFERKGIPIRVMKNSQLCQIYRWNKFGLETDEEADFVVAAFDPKVDIDLAKPWTISFWLNYSNSQAGSPFTLGENYFDGITIDNSQSPKGSLIFQYEDGGNCAYVKTPRINNEKWHHITWYQTGGSVGDEYGIYINGKPYEKCRIPREKNGTVAFKMPNFTGRLQDMRIYDFALSERQINAVYQKKDLTSEKSYADPSMNFEPINRWTVEGEEF